MVVPVPAFISYLANNLTTLNERDWTSTLMNAKVAVISVNFTSSKVTVFYYPALVIIHICACNVTLKFVLDPVA